MNHPPHEVWYDRHGTPMYFYSYHHVREWQIQQQVNGMARERSKQYVERHALPDSLMTMHPTPMV